MAEQTFTLACKGTVIGTITDVSYDTPTYGGKIEFVDKALGEQFTMISEFDAWVDSDAADDISDEEYDAEMAKRGIQQQYYDMLQGSGWVTTSGDGQVATAGLIVFDGDYVEWRPGEVISTS